VVDVLPGGIRYRVTGTIPEWDMTGTWVIKNPTFSLLRHHLTAGTI